MSKNKIDFKLVNIVLFFLAVYLVYQTKDFWLGVTNLILKITIPFLIAFTLAYAIYPLVRKLMNKNISKPISILIVLGSICLIFGIILILIVPTIAGQMGGLFNGIISFLKELSINYNINFKDIQNTLSSSFNNVLEKVGTYISNGAISVISISIDYMSKLFIILTAFIYFLIDMDKIRASIKKYLKTKSQKLYNYVLALDDEMGKYLSGFVKIVMISFVEYTITYSIIGHPDALMLGTLAALGNLIPYFGGILVNIIAAITAFVISPALFVKTCLVFFIFSGIDGNIINPLVYGKTNQIHPLVVIISVFVGGILCGVSGIIISLPLAIILLATYKYFKKDITEITKHKFKKA